MDIDEVLNEMAWFTEPVYEAASNENNLVEFFEDFGYKLDPNDISTIYSGFRALENSLTLIFENIEGGDNDFDPTNLIEIFNAFKTLGESNKIKDYFNTDFFIEIFDYLIIRYLSIKKPFVHSLLYALGVIEQDKIDETVRDIPYLRTRLNWSRIVDFIGDNKKWAREVYGWNGNPGAGDPKSLDYELLINAISLVLESSGYSIVVVKEFTPAELDGFLKNIPSSPSIKHYGGQFPIIQKDLDEIDSEGNPEFTNEAGLNLMPYGDYNSIDNLGFALALYTKGGANTDSQISERVTLKINIEVDLNNTVYIAIQPSGIKPHVGEGLNLKSSVEVIYSESDDTLISLLTIGETTKLEIGALKAAIGGDLKGDLFISGGVEKLKATIDLSVIPLLGNFVSEPIIIDVGDVSVKWQKDKGVSFDGGNNMEIVLPTHINLGPLNVSGLGLALDFAEIPNFTFDFSGKLSLGVLDLSFESVGFKTVLVETVNGILGNYDPKISLKPPSGLGIVINAGVVVGGGYLYFDLEKGEYAGALELTIAGFISVKAIGLISTKMPDGSNGFSLLVIITAEFFPPFQLGYGFTLNAVGGLLGLNRTVLLDPLRDGVRTGAITNIMFPTNVVANAPRIISDLKAIFPTYENRFLIGPMAKIGWGTPSLITLSFGLIIEIPGNIAILGVLKIILPDEKVPIVRIQVAFVGTIDFDRKMLTFDASLYESAILETMTLEGDMAVRLAWGDHPDFIMTVGGFHPSFTPPPLALPSLKRLSISILNTNIAKIRVECYQAVTSNTVQFGAKAEIYFDLKACSISGHISFDALFQFNPFYFIISLSAGFSLKAIGIDLMTVKINMSLEGPTPWRAKGTGKVSLFFFDISADFDKTWGENKNSNLPEINILPQFIELIQQKEQWSTSLSRGRNNLVTLRKLNEATESTLLLHPTGKLLLNQKLLPLKVNIDRIGNQKTADVKQLKIESANSKGTPLNIKETKDSFARAQFQKLTDAEKLSKPSFEKMQSGVEISMGTNTVMHGKQVQRKIEYELSIIDREPVRPFALGKLIFEIGSLFKHFLKGNSVSKSVLSANYQKQLQPFDAKLDIHEEYYCVAFQSNNTLFETNAVFGSEMEAESFIQDKVKTSPNLKNQIHIVPQYELEEI